LMRFWTLLATGEVCGIREPCNTRPVTLRT
jgi:hypothetical protein